MRIGRPRGWWKFLLLLAVAVAAALLVRRLADPVLHVAGVAGGPPGTDVIAPARPAQPADFSTGAASRLAIYLTDPTAP